VRRQSINHQHQACRLCHMCEIDVADCYAAFVRTDEFVADWGISLAVPSHSGTHAHFLHDVGTIFKVLPIRARGTAADRKGSFSGTPTPNHRLAIVYRVERDGVTPLFELVQ